MNESPADRTRFPDVPLFPADADGAPLAAPSDVDHATRPLSDRLAALVRRCAAPATLTCTFQPGGKRNGVGIASALWCRACGAAREWHDVAQGALLARQIEDSERLPFGRAAGDSLR